MSIKNCLGAKVAAGKLSAQDMADIIEVVDGFERRARARGGSTAEAAVEAAKALDLDAKRLKRVRKLAVAAMARVGKEMNDHPRGLGAGAHGLLSLDPFAKSRSVNVESRRDGIRKAAHALMSDTIEHFKPQAWGLVHPKAGGDDIARELFGESTGNEAAKQMAGGIKTALEYLRNRYNRAGGGIGYRMDFGLPQGHDAVRVGNVSREEWMGYVTERLDRSKMKDFDTGEPLNDNELRNILEPMYERIRTHGMSDIVPGKPGRKMLASKRMDPRILHFKNADAWLDYQRKFGGGDPFSIVLNHIEGMARDTSFMEVLGPNPTATRAYIRDRLIKAGDGANAESFGHVYDHLSGMSAIPMEGRRGVATFFGSVRNLLTAARLDRAILSSASDLNTIRISKAMVGMPQMKMVGDLARVVKGAWDEGDKMTALRVGLGADEWIREARAQARFAIDDVQGAAWTKRVADVVLRTTGLTPWTQAGENMVGRDYMGWLADHADLNLAALEKKTPELAASLDRAGIGPDIWDDIRKTPLHKTESGATYVNPMAVLQNEALGNRAQEAATHLQHWILTGQRMGIPAATARVSGEFLRGTRPGSLGGEVARAFSQFKTFSGSMIHLHLMHGMNTNASLASKVGYGANVLIGGTIMGALATHMSEILKGRDPQEMDTLDFWLQSASRGGGLGLFGDLLFQDMTRFDANAIAGMFGPEVGLGTDLLNYTWGNAQQALEGKKTSFGHDTVRMIRNYTPGGDAWYLFNAYEKVVLENVENWIDPDAAQRRSDLESRYYRERGQQFYWHPGDTLPSRLPNVGAAIGLGGE